MSDNDKSAAALKLLYEWQDYLKQIGGCSDSELMARVEACEESLAEQLEARKAAEDEVTRLRAEVARLRRARKAEHPGNMHWLAEDPEQLMECWSEPVEDRWASADTVVELSAAVRLPNIFVATRVVTADEHGDPDETEAAWFADRKAAEACYPDSLARARAALSGETAGNV
jgi:hypothetical protein